MRTLFFLLFSVALFQNCFAQKNYTTEKTAKKKLLESFRKGQRLMFNHQFDEAADVLEKVLKSDPTFIDAQIEWANVKNQQGKLAEAELGYEKAIAIDPAYEVNVFYSLAIVEFEQKKLDQAAKHFEQFLNAADKASENRKSTATRYLESIRFVAKALQNPVPFEPVNLGPNINTLRSEYFPTLTADGNTLIYCTLQGTPGAFNRQEDFFRSEKIDSVWQKGVPIAAINTPDNEGSQTISADGKLLIFTACNRPGSMGGCDLYFSESINGQMTQVKNLGAPVNSGMLETQPSLSADGRTLYFVRAPRNWEGNSDIWVSQRQMDGTWGEPKPIGPPINTPEQEQCPFIHPDGQTLYFLSEGHLGMGGTDLFFSKLQPDGTWSEPQNLGYPINSVLNEGPLTISLDGKTAYFASDWEGGFGEMDIYSFELYEAARPQPVTYVKATVTDASTRKPISAVIEFTDLATGFVHASSVTGEDGEFLVTLPAGKDYALNVSKEKYLFYSENFALTQAGTVEQPYLLDIALTPIPATAETTPSAKPVVLKNVFFETASSELKKESFTELDRLTKLLKDNPSLKIQVNGHTDNVGSEADNLRLSNDRAMAVYNFLIENGIEANRLKFKGFGETMPVAPNDSEEGRRQNRRTEFVIID